MKIDLVPCVIKFSVVALIFFSLHLTKAVITALFVTWAYQYVIAFFFGVKAMPSMDTICFMGSDVTRVNFISCSFTERYHFEGAQEKALQYMSQKAKLRSHVVKIFGDYYWKEVKNVVEMRDLCLVRMPREMKDERDIEKFCNEEINKLLPLSRP
jgi:hypothetical protein